MFESWLWLFQVHLTNGQTESIEACKASVEHDSLVLRDGYGYVLRAYAPGQWLDVVRGEDRRK